MIATIIILIVVLLVIFSFIYFHSKQPDNIYFVVAREWQTLIGAVLGFFAISVTIAGESYNRDRTEVRRKMGSEIAYLSSFKTDLNNILLDQSTFYPILFESEDWLTSPTQCSAFFDLHKSKTNWKFALEENFSSLINDVSPDTYVLMSGVLTTKKRFYDVMESFRTVDCIGNPDGFLKVVRSTHRSFGESFEAQFELIEARISELENDI